LFFAAIGLLFALFSDLMQYGIGAYALHHALILAAQDFVSWTLAGLVVARCVRPGAGVVLGQHSVRGTPTSESSRVF
jgi:hypothetical protein